MENYFILFYVWFGRDAVRCIEHLSNIDEILCQKCWNYLSSSVIIYHLTFFPDKIICEEDDFLCYNGDIATGGLGATCDGQIWFTPKFRGFEQEK